MGSLHNKIQVPGRCMVSVGKGRMFGVYADKTSHECFDKYATKIEAAVVIVIIFMSRSTSSLFYSDLNALLLKPSQMHLFSRLQAHTWFVAMCKALLVLPREYMSLYPACDTSIRPVAHGAVMHDYLDTGKP